MAHTHTPHTIAADHTSVPVQQFLDASSSALGVDEGYTSLEGLYDQAGSAYAEGVDCFAVQERKAFADVGPDTGGLGKGADEGIGRQ